MKKLIIILFLAVAIFGVCLIPHQANAAIAVGTHTGYSGASATEHTISHTTNAGDSLIVRLDNNNALQPTSVTFNGDALTLAINSTKGVDKYNFIYYLAIPDVGTYNVVINFGSSSRCVATATNLSGVDTANMIGATANTTADQTGTTPYLAITTTYANSLIVDASDYDSITVIPTASSTNQVSQGYQTMQSPSVLRQVNSYEPTTTAGYYTMGYTMSATTNTSLAIAEIRAAAVTNTCTYSGTGDWLVQQSDSCYITSNVYVNGAFNLIGSPTGMFDCAPGVRVSATKFNLDHSQASTRINENCKNYHY